MYSLTVPIVLATLFTGSYVSAAPSTCSGQQYNDIPGFPNSRSACYPTNYYQTSDLGQTSPEDARQRCQQQCTGMGPSCQSVVAQVNKAADSNLYSGTCFFFASGQTARPRRCTDTAYLLEGYMKDTTLACLSSSLPSASRFCSSYLSIPVVSYTATSTPPAVTITVISTSIPIVSTTETLTTTPTSTASSITTVTTTVTTSTNIITVTVSPTITTTTSTATTTVTVTTTVTAGTPKMKRATVPPPACITSDTPTSRLSAACSCLSVTTSTATTTTVLVPFTSTTSSTTTIPSTRTLLVTITAPAVTTITTGTTTTSVAIKTTTTTTVTKPITVTTTTTTTATATVTATQAPQCARTCPQTYDSYPLVYQGSYSIGSDNRIFCEYGPDGTYTNLCTYSSSSGAEVPDGSDPDCPAMAPCA